MLFLLSSCCSALSCLYLKHNSFCLKQALSLKHNLVMLEKAEWGELRENLEGVALIL